MAQQLPHPASELYFVMVLLLLSYVMSSAPRYVRQMKVEHQKKAPVPVRPAQSWKTLLNAYTIRPYTRAWKQLQTKEFLASLY